MPVKSSPLTGRPAEVSIVAMAFLRYPVWLTEKNGKAAGPP